MGMLYGFLAAVFAAASNLFLRRSLDAGGTVRSFLVIQMGVALLAALLAGPLKAGEWNLPLSTSLLGLLAGVVLAVMLIFLGKALEVGPAGLTFSVLSGATVMPAVVMTVLFGPARGFVYTPWHALGSLLVLAGLYWAGRGNSEIANRPRWAVFLTLMFSFHVILLVIFQWRAILINAPKVEEISPFFTAETIRSLWFMPMLYVGAATVQLAVYLRHERRLPTKREWKNGISGGLVSWLCTLFLVLGTQKATGFENVVIYPLYSIATVILSNLWSQKFYQEKVNWRAAQIASVGLFVGTVDWKAFLAALKIF